MHDLLLHIANIVQEIVGSFQNGIALSDAYHLIPLIPFFPSTIAAGEDIVPGDFVSTSSGAGDSGKVPKLGADGKLDSSFLSGNKFGGTGADGALSISSGTTTIDCAGASIVIKNYTSISITGTGKLAFSNPGTYGTIVILKSQGGVTLTSSQTPMIDMSAMGAASATYGWGFTFSTPKGAPEVSDSVGGTGVDGAVPGGSFSIYSKAIPLFTGGGGGIDSSGTGGRGGGGLYIECAGALNFTTAAGISVAGQNGVSGNTGGGAGGSCVILYGSLTAASGTITIAGGNGSGTGGGAGGNGTGGTGRGGNGGSSSNVSGSGGAGGSSAFDAANGTAGSNGTGGRGGGGGASGLSNVAANTEFA